METVLSIDGIGVCDHVHRSAMLMKVHSVPGLTDVLPFVRATNAEPHDLQVERPSRMPHIIVQTERGEQGDPSVPLLFSLAIHDSLKEVKSLMDPRDELLAFLDDVYVTGMRLPGRQVGDTSQHSPPHCGRRACGTGRLYAPEEWPNWDLKCGTQQTLKCWELQWTQQHSCRKFCEQKVDAGSAVVERHPFSPRLASSMADTFAVSRCHHILRTFSTIAV